jgi:hypothetical protein
MDCGSLLPGDGCDLKTRLSHTYRRPAGCRSPCPAQPFTEGLESRLLIVELESRVTFTI